MILKIERYVDGKDWWMLDDIKKVSKSWFKQPSGKGFGELAHTDVFILDYEDYLKKNDAGQEDYEVVKLICRLTSGDEFCVLFDTMAYLLNDNGKTIEKMVANYRHLG